MDLGGKLVRVNAFAVALVMNYTAVTSLTATTSAPTTAALDGSETRPFMFPLGDCASRENVFSVMSMTAEQNGGSAFGLSSEQRIFTPSFR